MKKIFVSIGALLLVACTDVNSDSEKNIKSGDDTIASVDISMSKMDGLVEAVEELSKEEPSETSRLLFKASGTEPGWIGEIYSNRLRLIVDYGKDSLVIEDNYGDLKIEKEYTIAKASVTNGKSTALAMTIKKEPCTAASGDKVNYTVSFKLNNKSYRGCGDFVK